MKCRENCCSRHRYNIIRLREPYEKGCADALLEVVSSANRTNIEEWKEDVIMCEALAKIMEPEIQQAKDKAKKAGWEEGRAEGRAEGHEEGWEEGIALAKLVIKLDAQGYDSSEIAEKTGVTDQQVRAILA